MLIPVKGLFPVDGLTCLLSDVEYFPMSITLASLTDMNNLFKALSAMSLRRPTAALLLFTFSISPFCDVAQTSDCGIVIIYFQYKPFL